jgi:tripartite-type tricarboxylate transporter receptor subunit TctC
MSGKRSAGPSRRNVLRAAASVMGTAATFGLGVTRARAETYPSRPVKIVVPFAPGGPTDVMARIVSVYLGEAIGSSVIVENKAGAGGNIGMSLVARAAPDGYTLLITSSAYVVNPGLYAQMSFDPYTDFEPVAELGTSPNVILVGPTLGINSLADLLGRAKADPNAFNYASPGIGTTPHLTGELLKIVAGIQMTHVPYSGAAPAIQAILGGMVPVAFTALPPAHQHIKNGSLKALALTGVTRWFDLPDVPTMIELGYKDFVSDTFQGFLAPAKTPAAIIELLSTKAIAILKTPEIAERLRTNGFEVVASGPDGMRRRIAEEVPKWRDVVAKAGIKPI